MMNKRFKNKAKTILSIVLSYLFVCQPMYASIPSDSRRCVDFLNQIVDNAMIFPVGIGEVVSGTKSLASGSNAFPVSREMKKDTVAELGRMPLQFVENHGQVDGAVRYYARKGGMTVYLTKTEIVFDFKRPQNSPHPSPLPQGERGRGENLLLETRKNNKSISSADEIKEFEHQVVRMKLQGANSNPVIAARNQQETVYNYFIGNDPAKWQTHVPVYSEVYYKDVYAGIDLRFYSAANGALEYDFIVHPGADPSRIAVAVEGVDGMEMESCGDLVIKTAFGDLKQNLPGIYQIIDGEKVLISSRFNFHSDSELQDVDAHVSRFQYGFTISAYDRTKDLVIDPLLASTLMGGGGYDGFFSMKIDASGNIFLTGETESLSFPVTSGAYDTTYDGSKGDTFVAKFKNDLSGLLSCTLLGGSYWDYGTTLGFDASGNVYIAGCTYSTDFPTTSGAYDRTFNGGDCDAFVAKFNSSLSALAASTLIGGYQFDTIHAMDIDPSGNVFVAGYVTSEDYPCTSGVYDASHNGGTDVNVSGFDNNLTHLLASTYIGGGEDEWADGLVIDGSGNIYITGTTYSSDYPSTPGAYDPSHNGVYDGFISKLNGNMTTLAASTFIGGSDYDRVNDLKIDTSGNVFVAGRTHSSDYPCTAGAYDASLNGDSGDALVSKLNGDLSLLLASTLIGGTGIDEANAICFDISGNVYIAGDTSSTDYPCSNGAYDTSYNGGDRDAFGSKLNNNLTQLLLSTYIGGTEEDDVYAMSFDAFGDIFVAGETESSDYPTTPGAYDGSFNDDYDAFISKFSEIASPPSALNARAISPYAITLSWKDNSINESGFKIEQKSGGCSAGGSWIQAAVKPANALTHQITGLTANTVYAFRIRAYNAAGDSAYSNCASAATGLSGTPAMPQGMTATSVSDSRVNLRWRDVSTNESGFRVYRRLGTSGPWSMVGRVAPGTTTFSDTTATGNQTSNPYMYYVRSYNAAGSSPPANAVKVPFPPTGLTVTPGTVAGKIVVSWTDNSNNETGFAIYRKDNSCLTSSAWIFVGTVGANRTSWICPGLNSGADYSFKVRAFFKTVAAPETSGYSSWSNCDDAVAPN
jgi:hypothetical protein